MLLPKYGIKVIICKVFLPHLKCEGEIREVWAKELLVGMGGGVYFL
jgi:hypothetical protein